MPDLYVIDNTWTHQQWVSTGGTRAKQFLQSPDGKFYYFKRSQLKEGRDYRYEFWSEIIVSEIGNFLGFNVLPYHIAIHGDIVGCICQNMLTSPNQELIELVKYLQAFAPSYNPTLKEHKSRYTFQLIENALEKIGLKHEFMPKIIEVILLDALIGNGDRHQENLGFISTKQYLSDAIDELQQDYVPKNILQKWITQPVMAWLSKRLNILRWTVEPLPKSLFSTKDIKFSPIYDSGSSLGRELTEKKLNSLLQNNNELEAYLKRGESEIHWEGGYKLTHFELITKLLNGEYRNLVMGVINSMNSRWNEEVVRKIVFSVDENLPEQHDFYSIPLNRKQLIYKILTSRFKILQKLANG